MRRPSRRVAVAALVFVCVTACTDPSSQAPPSPTTVSDDSPVMQMRPVMEEAGPRTGRWSELEPICSRPRCPGLAVDPNVVIEAQQPGGARFRLAPAVVTDADLIMAIPTQLPDVNGGGWAIDVTLGERGTQAMSAATHTAVAQPEPGNKLAIVVDGVVFSAPIVNEAIDSGKFVVTGVTGEADAKALIARILP
jgi:hypothetical protein